MLFGNCGYQPVDRPVKGVYCKNCKFYNKTFIFGSDLCVVVKTIVEFHPVKGEVYKKVETEYNPYSKNENFNCCDYKPSWWVKIFGE